MRQSIQRVGIATIAVFVVTAVWAPSSTPAEEATNTTGDGAAHYVGTYKYGKNLDHGRNIVRRAIGKAIESLPSLYRGLARRRVASIDPLVRQVTISLPGKQISVTHIGAKRATFSTVRGANQKVKNRRGNEVDLTQRFIGNRLEQIWVGPNSRRHVSYKLSSDSTSLVMATTIKNKRMSEPISYKLVYLRQ
jgi:hypothetical protein